MAKELLPPNYFQKYIVISVSIYLLSQVMFPTPYEYTIPRNLLPPCTHIIDGPEVYVHRNFGQKYMNIVLDGTNKTGYLCRELWCYQRLIFTMRQTGVNSNQVYSVIWKQHRQKCLMNIYYATNIAFLLDVHFQ